MPDPQPILRSVPPAGCPLTAGDGCTATPEPAPLRCSLDALRLLLVTAAQPLEAETLVVLLDAHGNGGIITVVAGTTDADSVLGVTECFSLAAQRVPGVVGLVVASVRPDGRVLPGDIDRWLDASAIAAEHDVCLIEWYVVGPSGAQCPRDLLGEPERWGRLRSA